MKLTNIELTTKDGKKIKLSLRDARKLYLDLVELFGSKTIFNPPVVIERTGPPWPEPRWPQILCSDNTSPLSLLSETAGEG